MPLHADNTVGFATGKKRASALNPLETETVTAHTCKCYAMAVGEQTAYGAAGCAASAAVSSDASPGSR